MESNLCELKFEFLSSKFFWKKVRFISIEDQCNYFGKSLKIRGVPVDLLNATFKRL